MPRAAEAPFRGVLFDLDGTFYDLRRLKRRLVKRIPREIFRHGLRGAWRRFRSLQRFRRQRERHRGSPAVKSLREVLLERVCGETGYPQELVAGAIDDFLYGADFPELRGLRSLDDRQVIETLDRRGYRLGVVSEYPVDSKLTALGLSDLPWRARLDCEMVGVLKPGPEIFQEGARRLGLAPERVLVVGDRRDADVEGAHAAGMQAAWLAPRDPGHGGSARPEYVLRSLRDLLPILPAR